MAGEHHYVRTTLIGGMLVVLPLFVFANLLLWLGTWIAGKTAPVAELIAAYLQLPLWVGHALTIATILLACFVLGAIVSTHFGNRAFNWLERNTVQRVAMPGSDVLQTVIACGAGSQRLLRSIVQPGAVPADTAPTI